MMADIVLAIGTSHSPMLGRLAEDHIRHAEIDQGKTDWKRTLLDKEGRPASYDELLSQADPNIAGQISEDIIAGRVTRCQQAMDRLQAVIAGADLDALIIVGDDQHEQFLDDNLPAVLIYSGNTIWNNVLQLPADAPGWWQRARAQYHEVTAIRGYPVAADLARHMVGYLMDQDFDISHSEKLPRDHGEGHAFGFVHRRLLGERPIPVVPVVLNTYFPPNQPTPRRCYALGEAIRAAIGAWPEPCRMGILASGGLSHFLVDEDLDRQVLDACRTADKDALCALPTRKLNSGNSEIRNWIVSAGAAEHLTTDWQEYVPCYRSEAGTGCGMAFAVWD
jgi:3-O-methylgallate 3,4-dioxygenase